MLNIDGDIFMYLVAAIFTVVIGIIIVLVYIQIKKGNQDSSYSEQLEELLTDEGDGNGNVQLSIPARWNIYWGRIAKESGLLKYADPNNSAGRDVLVLGIAVAAIVSAIFQNVLAGPVIAAALVFTASLALKTMSNKKVELINNQLPGFLFALKSNVIAGETLEKSFIKISEIMPQPLREDLLLVKNRLLANASFKDSLEELAAKTSSNDLRFLCSCMIQANGSGVSLENQITTIQEVIEEKQRISHEIAKGLKSATPSIWASSIVIPGSFLASYFMDANARDFWFGDIISWAVLIVVGVLWALGVYGTKKLADNIKNL